MKAEYLIIRAVALFGAVMMMVSCGGRSDKPLLPNVSGKAGEVIAVMDRSDWDGNLGSATRDLLAADYPFLPQREPLFPSSMSRRRDSPTCSRFTGTLSYIMYRRMCARAGLSTGMTSGPILSA